MLVSPRLLVPTFLRGSYETKILINQYIMRKRFNCFAILIMALIMSVPLFAQTSDSAKGMSAQALRVPSNFVFSRLATPLRAGGQSPAASVADRRLHPRAGEMRLPAHSVLYANALGDYNGLISYAPSSPDDIATYVPFDKSVFNAGSTIKDGKLCGIYMDQSMMEYGMIFLWYGWFDLATGEYDGSLENVKDMSLIAFATATDPVTGEVFGEFYDQTMQGWEFGVVDYDKMDRTVVSTTSRLYVAMGITARGEAYGITDDGNLYAIDRKTGKETFVGSTGVNIKDDNGMFYTQGGVIDPKTDTFFWACTDANRQCVIYTVDLGDASVTRVGSSPYQQVALNVLPPAAEDKAPAAVTDFAVSFDGPSTSGKALFTLPGKTFDGDDALTGQLTCEVSVNGSVVATAKGAPGEAMSVELNNLSEGEATIAVVARNDEGASPRVSLVTYVGYDKPLPPSQVSLVRGEGSTATLSWEAPVAGIHGGYMGSLTYNVYRIQGDKQEQVRQGLANTSTSIQLSVDGGLKNYVYAVEAVNQTQHSERAMSNNLVVGDALEVPFFDDFKESIDLYTVIDANADGASWSWDGEWGAARYNYSEENDADDWLITPPINLKAGRYYVVSYKARAASTRYPEMMEARWGNAPTVEAMTEVITPETDLDESEYKLFEKTISPSEDGAYYFGFHALSNAAEFYIFVDSVSVRLGSDPASPAGVDNLRAIPDERGELKATIAFNLPTVSMGGAALSQLTRCEVLSGDRVVASLEEGLQPGQAVSVTDEMAVKGVNRYSVYCYNEAGQGARADAEANVGLDYPAAPVVHTDDQQSQVRLYWDEIEGLYGGVVYQGEVACRIYDLEDEFTVGDQIGVVAGGTREYTVAGLSTDEGEQHFKWWAVRAFNSLGSSSFGKVSLLVGEPYALPFLQSFPFGNQGGHLVAFSMMNGMQMGFAMSETFDNDNGSIYLTAPAPASGVISLGKVATTAADSPVMQFHYKTPGDVPMRLAVRAKLPDGTVTAPIWEADLSEAENEEWQMARFDLPDSVFAARYFIPEISVVVDEPMRDWQVAYIDQVFIGALADGISVVENRQQTEGYNVYTIDGRRVLQRAKSLAGLRPGVYVVNGRTTIVRP